MLYYYYSIFYISIIRLLRFKHHEEWLVLITFQYSLWFVAGVLHLGYRLMPYGLLQDVYTIVALAIWIYNFYFHQKYFRSMARIYYSAKLR